MKRIACLLIVFLGWLNIASAQANDPKAEAILDKVSQKYKNMSAFKAEYTRSIESNDGEVFASMDGEITVKGAKFNLKMDDQVIICNGNTIWAYMKDANEVNISDYQPGADEITPTEIYSIYKKGYRYALMSELKDGSQVVQTIDLEPENKKSEIGKIRLVINKADNTIKKWIVFERGSNNRQIFNINSFTPNVAVSDADFTFDKAKHKGVRVVDLR
jgi:outer membrane lipoprotein carrier protein